MATVIPLVRSPSRWLRINVPHRPIVIRDRIFTWEVARRIDWTMKSFALQGLSPLLIFDTPGAARWEVVEYLRKAIQELSVGVYGLVDGKCDAAALYLLEHCFVRYMRPESRIKFGNISYAVCEVNICSCEDICVNSSGDVVRLYVELERTRRKVAEQLGSARLSHLKHTRILTMMRDEAEFSAEEAVGFHLADEIVQ